MILVSYQWWWTWTKITALYTYSMLSNVHLYIPASWHAWGKPSICIVLVHASHTHPKLSPYRLQLHQHSTKMCRKQVSVVIDSTLSNFDSVLRCDFQINLHIYKLHTFTQWNCKWFPWQQMNFAWGRLMIVTSAKTLLMFWRKADSLILGPTKNSVGEVYV